MRHTRVLVEAPQSMRHSISIREDLQPPRGAVRESAAATRPSVRVTLRPDVAALVRGCLRTHQRGRAAARPYKGTKENR